MTRSMAWLGFLGTALIVAALGIAALREPARQVAAAETIRLAAITEGIDLYAQNCVICHGPGGEGLAAYPPLNSEGIQNMDMETLVRTIERGRYNTAMAAFGVDEGGILMPMQVENLATTLQAGVWETIAVRVSELGLTPPQAVVLEVPPETLASVQTLAGGDVLAAGLITYADNCAACHGPNGEGSALAPALNSAELRARLTDADLTRIIQQGVPGTLMASWDQALDADQITSVISLIRRWEEVTAAGIQMPVIEAAPVDRSPAAIAAGQQLYSLLCTQCHGVDGFGTRLAPALNNQTFLSQTTDAAIQQIISLGVTGTAMPAWGGYLTEADIAALTAYLRSLEPTAPAMAAP